MNPSISIPFFVVLLAAFIHARFDTHNRVLSPSARAQDALPYRFVAPGRTARSLSSSAADNLEVVDVVILASVDGKLHALNRTTGLTLWSMGDDPDALHSPPTAFDSLVRTQHSSHEGSDQELFIIEPQSGDIYVLPPTASPSERLQRLPISMPQLVELSPFSFPGDDERMFVGSKETSMVVIDLDTGRVKGTVNADKVCFWDDDGVVGEEIDLDDLDGTKPPRRKLQSREVHIGRTDYHVRVHTPHQGVIQNLRFSSYGPNNIDRERQSQWKRTPDDFYIQPLSNGQILAFQIDGVEDTQHVSNDGMPIWARTFREPIVAVFDVLMTSSRSNPLALLQPRPHLEQLFPRRTTSKNRQAHNIVDTTYVGLVGDSLYAMSHENFPLVVFDRELPRSPTMAITEGGGSTTSVCEGRQCLVGSRRSEPSSQWYIPPLLDSVPHIPSVPERATFDRGIDSGPANADIDATEPHIGTSRSAGKWWGGSGDALGIFEGVLILFVLFVGALFGWRRRKAPVTPEPTAKEATVIPTDLAKLLPLSLPSPSPSSSPSIPSPPADEIATSSEADAERPTTKPELTAPQLPTPPADTPRDVQDGDDSEKEELSGMSRKRGPRRRKRGKKKKSDSQGLGVDAEDDDVLLPPVKEVATDIAVPPMTPSTPVPKPTSPSLLVSDTVLGFGSHGTVVYEGSLQGRAVAVKRLLQDFVTIAAREVELLQESDDHPNVIRYFYKESKDGFLYIALELCPASLAEVVERPDAFPAISGIFDPKRALAQVTAGLRHLHMLKIVHRDIKPQNILISRPKNGQHRMLISDFGLCKKLDVDQTSFLPTAHGAMAAGTVGWRAPEILRGDVKLDEQPMDPDDQSSRGSNASARSSASGAQPARLTKSVDVFALGCLFYYTMTGGSHPFGDRFEREGNIMKGRMSLVGLEKFGEEGVEAAHLVSQMLDQDAKARPDTTTCLIHPFFWTPSRRLNFLQDASDRFEIMCREPREAPLVTLETGAFDVVGNDWHSRLDRVFIENLGKFRKYDGRSVQDLLRALRNKKHHYQDMPDHVKRHLGPLPDGFLGYFTRRFPGLILHVHDVIWCCGLAHESMFRTYFELDDT